MDAELSKRKLSTAGAARGEKQEKSKHLGKWRGFFWGSVRDLFCCTCSGARTGKLAVGIVELIHSENGAKGFKGASKK